MVPEFKAAVADGKLSADNLIRLKATAVHRLKEQLPKAVADTARLAVYSLSSHIGARVQKAVLDSKG